MYRRKSIRGSILKQKHVRKKQSHILNLHTFGLVYDICCIGPLTVDTIINPLGITRLPGGTAYYFSSALSRMDLRYTLVTTLAEEDQYIAENLKNLGIQINILPTKKTTHFENEYQDNPDNRTQRVTQESDPIKATDIQNIQADIYHLGPLIKGDLTMDLIPMLSKKGKVSLDVQGFLRKVIRDKVYPTDWPEKLAMLKNITYLKASEHEMTALTGETDPIKGAKKLKDWGAKEIIITRGAKGSTLYTDEGPIKIPAIPAIVVDTTGCGDTYMAGYLWQRHKRKTPKEAAITGAAMATLKLATTGAFKGTKENIEALIGTSRAAGYI